jgi:peptide/nickel transport system substrate-binding protein
MRRLRSVAVPVAVCLLLLAAAAAATAASPTPGASPGTGRDVYRIGTTAAYDGLNPFTARGGLSRECLSLCYDRLTAYAADPAGGYAVTPDLASAWTPSDQGRVWTFTIRSGMTWQDGAPLTSADVAFTYEWIRATGERTYERYLAGVTGVQAPDAATFVVTCREPDASVPVIPIPILPAHVWRSYAARGLSAAKAFADLPPVGSGPFRVVHASPGAVALVPNPRYPAALGGPPHVRRLVFVPFAHAADMVRSYEAGDLDAAVGWPASDEAALRRVAGTAVSRAPGLGAQGLLFDCRPGVRTAAARLLRLVTVRQAVAWAIDRPDVAAAATSGLAVTGSSLLSPVLGDWQWQVPAVAAYRSSPLTARQLLDDAGLRDRDGDGVREAPDGAKMVFRLAVRRGQPQDLTAARMIVAWCAAVGIRLDLQRVGAAVLARRLRAAAGYDIALTGLDGAVDPGVQLGAFATHRPPSLSGYSDAGYDRLYSDQSRAVDVKHPGDVTARQALTDQLQAVLYRDCPFIPLWYDVQLQAWRTDDWTGYHPVPESDVGAPFWNSTRATYQDLQPRAAAAAAAHSTPVRTIAVVAAAAAVVAVAVLVLRRRRAMEDA